MSAFTLMADIVIVNMLFVLSSLPIVTGGMAIRAANVVTGYMVEGRGSRYGLHYLREFRYGGGKFGGASTQWWGILVALGLGVTYQQWVIFQAGVDGPLLNLAQGLTLSGILIITGISVWFFALQAQLDLQATPDGQQKAPLGETLGRSVILTFQQLPRTLGALLCIGAAASLPLWTSVAVWIPAYFFAVPALTLFLVQLLVAAPLGRGLASD